MTARAIHVIPYDDTLAHDESAACWCGPRVENDVPVPVIVHHSADRREEFEQLTGEGFPDKPWLEIRVNCPRVQNGTSSLQPLSFDRLA